jgi:agmatinase
MEVFMPFSPEFDLLPYNFLGLSRSASTYADSRAVVLPIPYEGTVSFHSGTRRGPQAIMLASRQVELYDPAANCEAGLEIGVHTLGELIINTTGPEQTLQLVREAAQTYVDDGKFLLALGGEHSITSALVEAHHKKFPLVPVLQIDAHLDLRDRWLGTEWSHASVMRRLVSRGHRVQAVGIRNISAEEADFVAQAGLDPVLADQVDSSSRWIDRALAGLGDADEVYISIDLDGLDPSVIRAVGTPEPAGLSWRQTIDLLTAVAARKRIVGADVVELCPQPGDLASDFAAAKLAYKLLTLAFYPPEKD